MKSTGFRQFASSKIICLLALAVGESFFQSCHKNESCDDSDVFVTVYQEANFLGKSQTFGIGTFTHDQFIVVGNDKISSIKLSSDKCVKVTLCEHNNPNNPGECKEYFSDQVFLDDMNYLVSFIKVEKR